MRLREPADALVMSTARKNLFNDSEGFTLIELLVVILIIGVLAAIAIPSFLNQRYKGQDACAKAMVKQMQGAAKAHQTENGRMDGLTAAAMTAIEPSIVSATSASCGHSVTNPVGDTASGGACNGGAPSNITFCVSATSLSGNSFSIAEGPSGTFRACTVGLSGNAGGCRAANTAGATGSW